MRRAIVIVVVLSFSLCAVAQRGGTHSGSHSSHSGSHSSKSHAGKKSSSHCDHMEASMKRMGTFDLMQDNMALTGSAMNLGGMGSLAQCFGSGTMMSGQIGPQMMSGNTAVNESTMMITMSWTPSGSMETNTMTMNGTMSMDMGSASGSFTLTGQTPGCTSQSGTFQMSRTISRMM